MDHGSRRLIGASWSEEHLFKHRSMNIGEWRQGMKTRTRKIKDKTGKGMGIWGKTRKGEVNTQGKG